MVGVDDGSLQVGSQAWSGRSAIIIIIIITYTVNHKK